MFYYRRNIRKVMGVGEGGGGLKTRKLCKRNCPKKIPEKEKPKEKRNFPQDGSQFNIKSVLNIISASGIKKKLMNTFYMLHDKF